MVILAEPREYLSDAGASTNTGLQNGVRALGRARGIYRDTGSIKIQLQLSRFQELMDIREEGNVLAEPQQQSA